MGDRYYKVLVGDWQIKEEEIHYPNGQEDIKIIPIVGGEGGRGTKSIFYWSSFNWYSYIITWCSSNI